VQCIYNIPDLYSEDACYESVLVPQLYGLIFSWFYADNLDKYVHMIVSKCLSVNIYIDNLNF